MGAVVAAVDGLDVIPAAFKLTEIAIEAYEGAVGDGIDVWAVVEVDALEAGEGFGPEAFV